jgi:hypothetical protein
VDLNKAFSFTEEMGALKYFPAGAAAIAKIAELVADLCANEKQARRLVETMCEKYDEWPGPVTLRQTYRELFGIQEPSWKPEYEAPPPANCGLCFDNGFHRNEAGILKLCGCDASKSVSHQMVMDFNEWERKRAMPTGEIIVRKKEPVQ